MKMYCGRDTFQSTPSAWRETLTPSGGLRCHSISIHSLRMEGDRSYVSTREIPVG